MKTKENIEDNTIVPYFNTIAEKILQLRDYSVPTNHEKERFYKHLEDKHNKRVIFSAPFGSGKTTFLLDYFHNGFEYKTNERTINDKVIQPSTTTHKAGREEYAVIYLRPIKYAISGNEDILKLIQKDILFQSMPYLCDQNLEASELECLRKFFNSDAMHDFLSSIINRIGDAYETIGETSRIPGEALNPIPNDSIAARAISENAMSLTFKSLGKATKIVNGLFNDTCKLSSQYKSFKGKIRASQKDKVQRLIDSFEVKCEIQYPQVINEAIAAIKNKNKILILDDIDRLDPEHIFRIFNVFSASIMEDGKGFYGFDKIIFVCDIDNIQRIFHNKYGADVDFSGYIDKFYSTSPFYYNIKPAIDASISTFVDKIIGNVHKPYITFLTYVLELFVNYDLINLRELHSLTNISFPITYNETLREPLKAEGHKGNNNIDLFLFFILDYVCLNIAGFEEKLDNRHILVRDPLDHYREILMHLAFFLNQYHDETIVSKHDPNEDILYFEFKDLNFKMQVKHDKNTNTDTCHTFLNGSILDQFPIFEIMILAYRQYQEVKKSTIKLENIKLYNQLTTDK